MSTVDYRIEVKSWMTKKSSPDFDFMERWNNDIPMPLRVMYGDKLSETNKMVKMVLHGDIREKVTPFCMVCGRPLTNKVSQFFGIGPECGNHNYVNPFNSEKELADAVSQYRDKLVSTVWTGWIPKSAILSIDNDDDIGTQIDNMPILVMDNSEDIASDTKSFIDPAVASIVESNNFISVITVNIGTPTRCTEDYSAYVSFGYDKVIVDTIKSLPMRFWDSNNKEWEIPYSSLNTIKSALCDYAFEISGEDTVPTVSSDIPGEFSYKTTPFAHQVEGLKYGMSHNRWLLCDEQGLGKTKQLIDLAVSRKLGNQVKHCLIICGVNGLKWNWVEEVEKHSNESAYILGQKITRKGKVVIGSNANKLHDIINLETNPNYFIITNIESLRNTKIADALSSACDLGLIGMVAIDEFHMCRNSFSQQSKGLNKIKPAFRIGMTGTPLMNTPLDFYQIFKWLGYEPYSFYSFRKHFCIMGGYEGKEVVGYQNLQDIQNMLDKIMLRRTKSEVLDLPDKVYINEYVELSDKHRDLYNSAYETALDELGKDADYNPLTDIIRMRQVTGGCGIYKDKVSQNPKLDRTEELVFEAINSGDKVVIFSQWVQMIDLMVERFAKYGVVSITGETSDSDRQELINRFQNDDSIKVFIGSMKAVGVGVTLTAASTVIFTDEPWTNGAKEQCADRCHRIGTTSTVTIHTIMAHNTIDERVHDIVMQKAGLADNIVDNNSQTNKKELYNYLLRP